MWVVGIEFDGEQDDWYNGPFLHNKFPKIDKKIQYYNKEISSMTKYFCHTIEDPNATIVTRELNRAVESFKVNMWIIELLTTEALVNPKRSHAYWKELFERCDI